MIESPGDRVSRLVFADWLEDHLHAVPNSSGWAINFRAWVAVGGAVVNLQVDADSWSIFEALVDGRSEIFMSHCVFTMPIGNLRLLQFKAITNCVFGVGEPD